jgi:hypothetical protein
MCYIAHVGREAVVNLCIEYAQGLYDRCCQHVRAEVLREACVAPRPSQAGVSDHWLIHSHWQDDVTTCESQQGSLFLAVSVTCRRRF